MKDLVNFINEKLIINKGTKKSSGMGDSLLKELITTANMGKCDKTSLDDMLQWIVDVLEDHNENTSSSLHELNDFNKYDGEDDIYFAYYDTDGPYSLTRNLVLKLNNLIADGYLYDNDSSCVFKGKKVKVYFQEFEYLANLKIGMVYYKEGSEESWNFIIQADNYN